MAWLQARGAELRFGRVLRSVEAEGDRAVALRFVDGDEPLGAADRVVLALPPSRLKAVLPGIDPPDDSCTIVNAFFRLRAVLPAETPPVLGVLNATAQWIFRRSDVVSVTVSAAEVLGLGERTADELAAMIWQDVRRALGPAAGETPFGARINREHRATFDQSPAGVAKRLTARTSLPNLLLAGDSTDTGLPATIEGAIRSGEHAASLLS